MLLVSNITTKKNVRDLGSSVPLIIPIDFARFLLIFKKIHVNTVLELTIVIYHILYHKIYTS